MGVLLSHIIHSTVVLAVLVQLAVGPAFLVDKHNSDRACSELAADHVRVAARVLSCGRYLTSTRPNTYQSLCRVTYSFRGGTPQLCARAGRAVEGRPGGCPRIALASWRPELPFMPAPGHSASPCRGNSDRVGCPSSSTYTSARLGRPVGRWRRRAVQQN